MSYVFLLLTVSTALGVALLFAVDKGSRVLFRLWRWLIHRLGPGVFPSAWGMMNGVLPLALLSLAIGVWLGLAVTPGMAKLAPGPIEDVDRLASGFTLVGMIGCGLRGLHYMACRTLETAAPAPPSPKPASKTTPTQRKPRRKAPGSQSGKTVTQPKARRRSAPTTTQRSSAPSRRTTRKGSNAQKKNAGNKPGR